MNKLRAENPSNSTNQGIKRILLITSGVLVFLIISFCVVTVISNIFYPTSNPLLPILDVHLYSSTEENRTNEDFSMKDCSNSQSTSSYDYYGAYMSKNEEIYAIGLSIFDNSLCRKLLVSKDSIEGLWKGQGFSIYKYLFDSNTLVVHTDNSMIGLYNLTNNVFYPLYENSSNISYSAFDTNEYGYLAAYYVATGGCGDATGECIAKEVNEFTALWNLRGVKILRSDGRTATISTQSIPSTTYSLPKFVSVYNTELGRTEGKLMFVNNSDESVVYKNTFELSELEWK